MHQHIRTSLQLQIAPAGTHFFQNNCTHGHDSKDARSSASAASSSRSGLQITVTAELRFALPTGCYADLYELRALQAQAQLLLPHEDEGFNPAHSSIHTYTSTHKHTVLTFPQLLAVTVVPDGQVAMETVARSPLESGIESESGSGSAQLMPPILSSVLKFSGLGGSAGECMEGRRVVTELEDVSLKLEN